MGVSSIEKIGSLIPILNFADNDEGPSSDDLYYEEEEYDKGESPSLEIENDYQGGDGLLKFLSLLDNVPNYLVGWVIQKR